MKYTILIKDENKVKKITKIITYSEGGFAVAVPYHNAKNGHLIKYEIDYDKKTIYVIKSDTINYVASDRVKLSIHQDGFVQFSGENSGKIISGRDENGNPKGLGYLTSPLSNPILTGPTLGVLVWGLEDFTDFDVEKASDEIVLFNNQDIYLRDFKPNFNGYFIECFVFPIRFFSGVRIDDNNKYILEMCFKNFEAYNAVIKLKVLPTDSKEYFLGLMASKVQVFQNSPSGFSLNAPSKLKSVKDSTGTVMAAIYPAPNNDDEIPSINLDFKK
jgi:hypothetical protein